MAKVTAVETPQAFFEIVKKSGLVAEEQLEKLREAIGDAEDDPKQVARQFMKGGLLTGWQAGQLLAGYHALVIGKYKLCKQLGVDELGRVFLAEHSQLGRNVALKTLSSRHTSRPEVVKRFLSDARQAATLDHRNIVHLYDVDSEGDRYIVVMEHFEGRDLQELVEEKGKLPLAHCARFVRQACQGLAHAHEHQAVHGAIRPASLLVDGGGNLKIFDFGVAQLANSNGKPSANSASLHFKAPEQSDDAGKVGPQGDIYSLGCTLFFLLTGKAPGKVGDDIIKQLKQLRPDTPAPLAEICGKMAAADPADRFESASEAGEQLQQWLDSATKAAQGSSQAGRETKSEKPLAVARPIAEDKSGDEKKPVPQQKPAAKKKDAPAKENVGIPDINIDASGGNSTSSKAKPQSNPDIQIDISGGKPARGKATPQSSADIKIDTKSKSTTPKPRQQQPADKFKPKEAPAKSDDDAPAKKGKPLALIIGASAGGLAVVAAIVFGIMYFLAGGEGEQSAQADTSTEQAAGDDSATENLETNPEVNPEIDPEVDPEVNPAVATPEENEAEASEPAANDASAAEPPAAETAAATENEQTEPPANDPEQAVAAAAPDSSEPPATGADSAAPTEEKSEPEPAAEADEKPAPKPEPPPANSFRQLAAAIDLPPIEEGGAPATLGTIDIDEKTLCFIKIRGGENALRGSGKFTIKNAEGGLAERDWEVSVANDDSSSRAKIALLSLKDKQLTFQWTPGAAEERESEYLRNCVLSFNADADKHVLALRKPVEMAPLAVDFNRATTRLDVKIAASPDPEAVEVKIEKVNGPFPGEPKFDPPQPLRAARGSQRITFGDKPEDQMLFLIVTTSMRRNLEVEVAPMFKIEGFPETKFNKANVEKAVKSAQATLAQSSIGIKQMEAVKKQLDKDRKKRNEAVRVGQQLSLLKQRYEALKGAMPQIEKLKTLYDSLSEQTNIEFRVYSRAGASEVELARAGGAGQGGQ